MVGKIIGIVICLVVYILAGICSSKGVHECTDDIYQIMTDDWMAKAPRWAHIVLYALSPLWIVVYLPLLVGYLIYAIYKLVKLKREIQKLKK